MIATSETPKTEALARFYGNDIANLVVSYVARKCTIMRNSGWFIDHRKEGVWTNTNQAKVSGILCYQSWRNGRLHGKIGGYCVFSGKPRLRPYHATLYKNGKFICALTKDICGESCHMIEFYNRFGQKLFYDNKKQNHGRKNFKTAKFTNPRTV